MATVLIHFLWQLLSVVNKRNTGFDSVDLGHCQRAK